MTGASRGLGAGMAIALAGAGAEVVLHASERPPERTAAAIEEATGRVPAMLTADLGDRAAADRLIPAAIAAHGRLDILINNAGLIRRQPAATHGDDDWDRVLEVDLSSVFRLCRAAGQHLIERGQGGKIINVASLLSFQGGITVPGYAAAKGGVMQLTKALANEWARQASRQRDCHRLHGDRTTTERCGPMRCAIGRSPIAFPPGAWARRRTSSARRSSWLRTASDYVNGPVLVVDGGWGPLKGARQRILALLPSSPAWGWLPPRSTPRTTAPASKAGSSTRARRRCPASTSS